MSSTDSSNPAAAASRPGPVGNDAGSPGAVGHGASADKGKRKSGAGVQRRQQPMIRQQRFEGKCEDLKGHIYDCSDSRQADLYTKTTKEIAEYVGKNYKYGNDVRLAVESLTPPTLTEPSDPPQGASQTRERIWEKEVDEYVKRKGYLAENLKTLFSLIWGQCTDAMRAKIDLTWIQTSSPT